MIQINEIFKGISGEAGTKEFPQGSFCTFVRFQGCNLSCKWCDSERTHDGTMGRSMNIGSILTHCATKKVLITGGEPLFQRLEFIRLCELLIERGHIVQVETNGSYMLPEIADVQWIIDYKLPSSRMMKYMIPIQPLFNYLIDDGGVMVKMVYETDHDVAYMLDMIQVYRKKVGFSQITAPFIISPTPPAYHKAPDVMKKIFELKLQEFCIFSLQIHKILGLP